MTRWRSRSRWLAVFVCVAFSAELAYAQFGRGSSRGGGGFLPGAQDEADRLRQYLEKGGFLWVDDFWGEAAWAQWAHEFGKAMPPDKYPIEDIPLTDPMFKSMLVVTEVPQVSSIRFWRSTGGQTSER